MGPKKIKVEGRTQKRPAEEIMEELEDTKMIDETVVEKKSITSQSTSQNTSSQEDLLKKLKPEEPIPREFYMCDVAELAEKLIGTYLVRELEDGQVLKAMIVETEAYKAPLDKACHAYNNKKTDKTKWFWQEGGHLYMYSIYGNNNCMNIVSASKEEPEAVLIRAIEPIQGITTIRRFRGDNPKMKDRDLSNGPGKLTQAMNIFKDYNGHDITQKGKLYLTKGVTPSKEQITATKRINIDYAEEWTDKLWRFILKGNQFVSK